MVSETVVLHTADEDAGPDEVWQMEAALLLKVSDEPLPLLDARKDVAVELERQQLDEHADEARSRSWLPLLV